MPRCLVALGSNRGDPVAAVDSAIDAIRDLPRVSGLTASERFTTDPVGAAAGGAPFVNAVVALETGRTPADLLAELRRIEVALGRQRRVRWGPREIDLDLLLHGESVVDQPGLRVPHPRMTFRPFVLEPACEVAADWRHPECEASLGELWRQLRTGADALRLVGDLGDAQEIARWVATARPDLSVGDDRSARLTIDAEPATKPLGPSGPRLALADCPREHWRDEVLAALECVWPARP